MGFVDVREVQWVRDERQERVCPASHDVVGHRAGVSAEQAEVKILFTSDIYMIAGLLICM